MEIKSASIVNEYLNRFPDTPSLTLAKKIYAEQSIYFKDIDCVRSYIRRKRGQCGERIRSKQIDKSMYREPGKYNPFQLPKSYSEERKPFKLPLANNNILFISDLHIPYHDVTALNLALEYGKKQKVNTIFINGDLLDFHQLSRFQKDPKKRSVKEEFDICKDILKIIRKQFPKAAIYYLKGNHCMRYEKWLVVKAPEVFDMAEFQLETLLELNKFKVTAINDNVLVKFGKLNVSHGHHIIKGVFAPVNSARGAYLKAKASIIIGHTHQVSNHVEKTANREIISCWSVGCLCELQPDYDPMNTKASHGFAHITIEKNGNYHVDNKMIFNGAIL